MNRIRIVASLLCAVCGWSAGQPPRGADGREAPADLLGHPILVQEFRHGERADRPLVKTAAQLARRHGEKGLIVVLVETTDAEAIDVDAALLRQFPDSGVWIAGRGGAFDPPRGDETGMLTHLIGVDGRTVLLGSRRSVGADVEREILRALAARRRGWGPTDAIRRFRQVVHVKGALGVPAEKLAAEVPSDVAAELEDAYRRRRDRIARLKRQGRWIEALEAAERLERDVAGRAEWTDECRKLLASFETPRAKKELGFDRVLGDVLRRFEGRTPKKGHLLELRGVARHAERAGGRSVAERAKRLLAVYERMSKR